MARVPTYNGDTVPSSGGPTFQTANVDVGSFGGNQARQLAVGAEKLAQAGDQVGALAVKIQTEENQKAVKAADTEFRQGLLGLQYGDGTDTNTGFYGLSGDQPQNQYKDYLDRANKLKTDILTKLRPGSQTDDFTAAADRHLADMQGNMARYVGVERKKSLIATSEARLGVATSEAALAYNDPKVLANSLATARGEAVAQAQLMGASPEVTKEIIRKAETQVLSATILATNEKDPEAAHALLKQNIDRMDTKAALTVQATVQKRYLEVKSQSIADEYYGMIKSGKMDEEQARGAIRKAYSGDEETAAIKELDNRIGDFYRTESQLRARRAEARTLQNEKDAEARRQRADARREEQDAIAAIDREARLARQKAADLRRDKADAAAVQRAEEHADALARQTEDRKNRLLRQQAADLRRAQGEELATQTNEVSQTITDQGGTLEERIGKVRDQFVGELRTRVERLVTEMYARDRKIAEEARANKVNDLQDRIQNGTKFDDIPQAERSFLKPSEEAALRVQDRRRQLNIPNVSTPGYMGAILDRVASKNVDELLAIPLEEARSNLDDGDYQKFWAYRQDAARGKFNDNVSGDAAFAAKTIGGYVEFQGNSNSKKAARNRLTEVIVAEINALRGEKRGQKITDAERQDIVQRAIKAYVLDKPGVIYGRNLSENVPVVNEALKYGPKIAIERAAGIVKAPLPADPAERSKALTEIYHIELTDELRSQGREYWFKVFGRGAQSPTDAQLKALYWKAQRNR